MKSKKISKSEREMMRAIESMLSNMDGDYHSHEEYDYINKLPYGTESDWKYLYEKYVKGHRKHMGEIGDETLKTFIQDSDFRDLFYETYRDRLFLPEHWLENKDHFIAFTKYLCVRVLSEEFSYKDWLKSKRDT